MNQITSRTTLLMAAGAVWLLCPFSSQSSAAQNSICRFRPGVHVSREHPLNDKQLKILLDGLRFWTGFIEIGTNAAGDVTLGSRSHTTDGSSTARELITAAVDGQDSFILENRDHSPDIAFARIKSNFVYEDHTGARRYAWQIQIDFSDFNRLLGDHHVLAAFDPAINLLHELVHGVLRYPDPIDINDRLGQCERHINRIRAELGLPQRQNYYPLNRMVTDSCAKKPLVASELTFFDSNSVARTKRDFVIWFKTENVIDMTVARSRSETRSELAALVHGRLPN